MRLKFSPVCLRERLQVHLFLWLCGIKIRNQRITVRLLRTIVRGMLTFALMRNTASETTEAEVVLRDARQ